MGATETGIYIENYVICETDKNEQSLASKARLDKKEIVHVK